MVQAPQHFQCEGIVPTEPSSPNSRTSLFHCLYTSLPVSSSTPVLSFSLPHLFFPVFFTLPTPPPPPPSLPEALSSELPRFFIKELSLKPSNYYGERENTERREGGHLRGKICFSLFPSYHSLICTNSHPYSTFLTVSSHNVKRHRVSIAHLPLSLSVSVRPIPSIPFFHSVCSLSQVKC